MKIVPKDHIVNILNQLPNKPGVYQYYDIHGKLLYIGKAKKLKSRVRSYFNNDLHGKTIVLVKKIADIKFIIVPSEQDALFLENNLIKKYQPPYNIQLKDDKTYPWICIKKEPFPRVFKTRNIIKDGSKYFGPYASVKLLDTLLELINKLFPLRNCNYDLSQDNINAKKFKVCLEYHIGNCLGPCINEEKESDYATKIFCIEQILNGDLIEVKKHLENLMKDYSNSLKFEEANEIKSKIDILNTFQSKSTIVNPKLHNLDVFGYYKFENNFFVNYLKVNNGAIIQGHTVEVKPKLNEESKELLIRAIIDIRERFNSSSNEVVVPFNLDVELDDIKFIVPKKGDKLKLLELSTRNAKFFGIEKRKISVQYTQKTENSALVQMKKDLNLTDLPVHIECFDNSNIQGTNPVGACVVFKDGKPSKKDYRIFNIKTVDGPDDFASMEEVIFRRYKRMLEENSQLPDLIIIDGGKGQLGSAIKSLKKLNLIGKIAIIGIAKRLEEIYFPGDKDPIYIDKRSSSLKLIQYLRNEAHRFGITKHRDRRSKGFISSELDLIEGVGPKTKETLLKTFKTINTIKNLKQDDLEQVVGYSKAKKIYDYFKKH